MTKKTLALAEAKDPQPGEAEGYTKNPADPGDLAGYASTLESGNWKSSVEPVQNNIYKSLRGSIAHTYLQATLVFVSPPFFFFLAAVETLLSLIHFSFNKSGADTISLSRNPFVCTRNLLLSRGCLSQLAYLKSGIITQNGPSGGVIRTPSTANGSSRPVIGIFVQTAITLRKNSSAPTSSTMRPTIPIVTSMDA
ncbi:MAG: hypothetical protein L6R39_006747 [Caloplaca ligustica]|nr:MAG: hypothetical protein L6R39_006747 [Caloplaca ligustica]